MKKECISMLLAGGQGSRLYALTEHNAKPALPFGGKYRIIDFPLSNCANSGIDTVGVLTQYQPTEAQLPTWATGSPGTWTAPMAASMCCPPTSPAGDSGTWYKGTANAIYQNIGFIDLYDPEYVLILSGDHIYKMDYAKMLAYHKETGADCHHLRAGGAHGGGQPVRHHERRRPTARSTSLRRSPPTPRATWPPWASISSPGRSCAST